MDRYDCVWVTLGILTNQRPNEIDQSLSIVRARPESGTQGVDFDTISSLLRTLSQSAPPR